MLSMPRRFADLRDQGFDLLVVGGGVYGAWTACDAVWRGLSVALVDQGDWAGATSSASTKLIHGGLRYLAQGNLGLVRKSLAERSRLLRLCPHRVRPLHFGIPLYGENRFDAWRLRMGLDLYDRLGGLRKHPGASGVLPAEDFGRRFPWVGNEGLKGGLLFTDARTDDARFVLELVCGAQAAGAVAVNYCKVLGLDTERGRAVRATVEDGVTGERARLRARCIVRATGPWIVPGSGACRLSKGVHLVLPALPGEEALLFFSASDGRVIFLIPWYGRTLLGTTDTDYAGDPARVTVEPADVAYLLDAANRLFGVPRWDKSQVLGGCAGLRVLRDRRGASSYSLRRDWALEETADGVLVSVGGKLTSARQDAAFIVDRVCQKLGVQKTSSTGERPFPWAPDDFAGFERTAAARGRELGLTDEEAGWLVFRHGRRADRVLNALAQNSRLGTRIRPDLPLLWADLVHCARHEMVVHLDDSLRRRLPLLMLGRFGREELQGFAAEVAPLLDWDAARRDKEVERCVAGNWAVLG
jgi:glycerol-3-phosphate dehydrogenase